MNYSKCQVLSFCLLLLVATLIEAGQKDKPADDLIKLNVLVLDAQNRPTLDLKQEDIRILEDSVPQTITYFSKDEFPLNYCLVIDTSGSRRKLMSRVINGAKAILTHHKPGDNVALIEFKDQPELLVEFTPNKDTVVTHLEALLASRQTAIIDAVYLAAKYVAEYKPVDPISRRVIILMSDGAEQDSYYKLDELKKHLRKENIQIFVIGFDMKELAKTIGGGTQKKAKDLLREIAKEAGGLAFFPESESELQTVSSDILSILRKQYLIGYKPNRDVKKGSKHTVSVIVNDAPGGEKRTAITRAGYIEK